MVTQCTKSHEHQCGSTWMPSGRQRSEGRARQDRKALRDHRPSSAHGRSIARRIRDHEEDRVDTGVPRLQGDPAKLSLGVIQTGLAFGMQRFSSQLEAEDHCVPRSEVAFDLERDLDSDDERRGQPLTQPIEQRDLGRVSERSRAWIGAKRTSRPTTAPILASCVTVTLARAARSIRSTLLYDIPTARPTSSSVLPAMTRAVPRSVPTVT